MPRADPLEVWNVEVLATSIRVSLIAREGKRAGGTESRTWVSIEGRLDRPVKRSLTAVNILACHDEESAQRGAGHAIGGSLQWEVVTPLLQREFEALALLVALERLERVRLVTERIRYGKGTVRSVSFETRPMPSEEE